jgi:diadenosine tetraphosphatase ApaH/serine/threonine PP2A family protein phosphatase
VRILVVSDIHANLPALDAVLAAARSGGGFARVWSLGDTVGYGPQPNECLERMQGLGALSVAGNHEGAVLGQLPLSDFNPAAARAIEWTVVQLSGQMTDYLRTMPARLEESDVTLVHGSPRDPAWEYLSLARQAADNLASFTTQGCAHGHTHVPAWLSVEGQRMAGGRPGEGTTVKIGRGRFYLNPGSVGQPRDGDSRASYAVVDLEVRRVTFRRVPYDIRETQRLMQAAGLPAVLINRLSIGR